jgi:hypothetical protein
MLAVQKFVEAVLQIGLHGSFTIQGGVGVGTGVGTGVGAGVGHGLHR